MGCFCGVYLSWIVNRAIQNHGHRVDLSIDPPCYDVDDQNSGVTTDANRDLHTNDQLDDLNLVANRVSRNCALRDPKTDGNLDVSLCHHTNDRLDDHLKDDDHRDVLVDHRMNVTDDRKTDANRVSRRSGVHLNAQLVYEHRVDLTIDPECYVRHDLSLDAMTDGSHDHRTSDLLGDLSLDASRANRRSGVHLNAHLVYEHRVDLTIDPECYVRRDQMKDVNLDVMRDGSHVNRNYAPRDRKMVLKKCHRVDLPIDPECYAMNRLEMYY
jgi:hypothetical protein